jgi:hypothetical protein
VPKSLENSIAEVDRYRKRGDLLLAYDKASEYVRSYPESEAL